MSRCSSKRALPVHVIGARWGFPNEAHFNRTFSAAFDISPAAYRRRLEERHDPPAEG
ncbi:AraC family transcriptional regulator [Streptosporangium sp. NBC_01469]|uniref:AraC family transcriptional regulator n=1 Tax=Streptosporangium sp. NBC_01469 TaxID=2903898 RepID=UPI002E2C623B|nr:AraC family transcriptional regulator [Streptosporangium sp. NBC_01469]